MHHPSQRSGLPVWHAALALSIASTLLAPACARSRGPGRSAAGAAAAPERDPIPEAEFEPAMARARCEFEAGCCRRVGLPGVVDSCERTWRILLANDRPSSSSGARYDGAAAAACIAELAEFECPHVKDSVRPWPEPCGRIYRRGGLQVGERCSKPGPYECALANGVETACWNADGLGTYQCLAIEERGEGEPCRDAEPVPPALLTCAPPLRCDFDRGLCVRVPERGEPCDPDPFGRDSCARGSVCDGAKHLCVAPAAAGEPCDPTANLCEASRCLAGRCREPTHYSVELCAKP